MTTNLLESSNEIPDARDGGMTGMTGREGDATSGRVVEMFKQVWCAHPQPIAD